MKVLIVDDHQMLRETIRRKLVTVPRISEIHEAGTVAEALSVISSNRPDVCFVDPRLPDGTGFDVYREIKALYSGMKVVIFSAYAYDQYVRTGLRIGVDAFIFKTDPLDSVLDALEACLEGRPYFSPSVIPIASNLIAPPILVETRARDALRRESCRYYMPWQTTSLIRRSHNI